MRYAYGYDPGGKLQNALGVRGIPNALLVDPSGTIIWQGHPGSLTEGDIKKALKDVIEIPIYEWGKSAKAVKKAFLKGDFAKAIAAADKLGEKDEMGTKLARSLRGMLTSRVAGLEANLESGDVYKAFTGSEALSKGTKGLPEQETLKAIMTKVSKDPELKTALDGQSKLADIMSMERAKWKDCDTCVKKLKKLKKNFEGTHTGELIDAAIDSIDEARRKMKR